MNSNILETAKKVHLIGVGGISMSSIAFVLKRNGADVSGSDINKSKMTDELENFGIKLYFGHSEENITPDIDVVIYTADVHDDNCELIKAKELGIPCLVRAVALGLLMKSYKTPIGVSGTHGKSTTTSMLNDVFTACGTEPTVLAGAEMASTDSAYKLGKKDYFIFEACEYTASFLSFFPKIALILNVEEDHLDYYKDIEDIKRAFSSYANLCGKDGTVIANGDCKNTMDSISEYQGNIVTFGMNKNWDFYAENIVFNHGRPSFDVYHNGTLYVKLSLSVFGKHNIMNALASVAASYVCKLDKNDTANALNSFKGAKRRFELVKNYNGADIVSDYAHHPTEIETTLNAAMQIGYKKVTCIFQPHTFTRTHKFFDGFVKSLSIPDCTVLAPVYAKRDTNIYGEDSGTLSKNIPNSLYLPSLQAVADYIKSNAKQDELYILMGAGDINKVADML